MVHRFAANQTSFLCALFALIHGVIYFVTDNATQKKLLLVRARHPNMEVSSVTLTVYGKVLQWNDSFTWCSQQLQSLIQFKKYLLVIYHLAYTEASLYNSNVVISSRYKFWLQSMPQHISYMSSANNKNNNEYLLKVY